MLKVLEEKTGELMQLLVQRVVQQQTHGKDCTRDSEVLKCLASYRETVLIPAIKQSEQVRL